MRSEVDAVGDDEFMWESGVQHTSCVAPDVNEPTKRMLYILLASKINNNILASVCLVLKVFVLRYGHNGPVTLGPME